MPEPGRRPSRRQEALNRCLCQVGRHATSAHLPPAPGRGVTGIAQHMRPAVFDVKPLEAIDLRARVGGKRDRRSVVTSASPAATPCSASSRSADARKRSRTVSNGTQRAAAIWVLLRARLSCQPPGAGSSGGRISRAEPVGGRGAGFQQHVLRRAVMYASVAERRATLSAASSVERRATGPPTARHGAPKASPARCGKADPNPGQHSTWPPVTTVDSPRDQGAPRVRRNATWMHPSPNLAGLMACHWHSAEFEFGRFAAKPLRSRRLLGSASQFVLSN